MLPIVVFANIYHHSIPGLSAPVTDKTKLSMIFSTVFIFGFVAYTSIGSVVAFYFGDNVQQSANINWTDFHGSKLISLYVIVFPATDVVSAFPLNAITLGNNLMSAAFGDEILEADRATTTLFRVLAAVPSIIGACFVRDLGKITDYTGMTGFGLAFIFPALLHLWSKKKAVEAGLSGDTIYSMEFMSKEMPAHAVVLLGVFLIIFVLLSLMLYK